MRKDIKKSSYYVWFLGAEEAKGLRGAEFITPVVRSLVERERDVEPFKVTLQISHKGLKIVQNVSLSSTQKSKKGELVKHFIPDHAVTCVLQDEDIVACILLLYNPVTKCPVHVHAYRCDSVETASVLSSQLQTLTERPENQKKLAELEAKGLLVETRRPAGSDGRSSSARESESSGGSSSGVGRVTSLYDSLAAELRDKLSTRPTAPGGGPILLPPRDYDTVHRQKGNLSDIDKRRCLNLNIVGVNASPPDKPLSSKTGKAGAKVGSSGGSSGIGSDHAPSPDHEVDARFLDNHSTSDEDWSCDIAKSQSLFLMQTNWKGVDAELSLPRARRADVQGDHPQSEVKSHSQQEARSHLVQHDNRNSVHQEAKNHLRLDLEASQRRRRNAEERQRSPSPPDTPRERFNDAKEKFLLLERERLDLQDRQVQLLNLERRRQMIQHNAEPPISPSVLPSGPFQRSRLLPNAGWSPAVSKDSEEDPERRLPKDRYYPPDDIDLNIKYMEERDRPSVMRRESLYRKVHSRDSMDSEDYHPRHQQNRAIFQSQESRRNTCISPTQRSIDKYSSQDTHRGYNSPSPPLEQSPASRESQTSPQTRVRSRAYAEDCRSPGARISARSENIPLERYRSPNRMPRPVPRHQRYPSPTESEKKKPMYEMLEDERRRSSNELAKEFKRRSYQELEDHERYPGLDRESAAVGSRVQQQQQQQQQQQHDENTPRYRHSYAEYGIKHELLHRTNSSVSSGRVGIAAIHPY